MSLHILLDSQPLGLISTPGQSNAPIAITNWAAACLAAGHKVYIPEIIKLDRLRSFLRFLPISSAAMMLAADLWATSRQSGFPTGDPKKLDIDVILSAQALTLGVPAADLLIATSNVRHIARFVSAEEWQKISP